jgi:adenylylsulfate kinase-like enzyme
MPATFLNNTINAKDTQKEGAMPTAEVLLLHGSPGSGKSIQAGAVAEQLREADQAHAVIDLDELNIIYPNQDRRECQTTEILGYFGTHSDITRPA